MAEQSPSVAAADTTREEALVENETRVKAPSRSLRSAPLGVTVALAAVAALVWLGLTARGGMLSLLTTMLMYVMLVQGWNLLGGYGGYLNLGMAAFFGIGAYTTGVLSHTWGVSPPLAVLAAAVVGAVFALVIGIPTLRLRGPYFTILTLVIGFLMMTLTLNVDFTRGAMGLFLDAIQLGPLSVEQSFFFIYLVLAFLVVLFVWRLEGTRFIYALRAIKEDEDAAEILGVSTTRVKIQALMLGAVIAGIAGGLFSYRIGYIEPTGVFDINISIDVVLMAVVGGAGSWIGPVIGAPLILGLQEFLRVQITNVQIFGEQVPRESNRMVLGVLLVVVALYAKRGVVGLVRRERGSRIGV